MKIVFRLNYHTAPGQSLWLKYSTVLDGGRVRFDQVAALRWLNERQWEVVVELKGAGLMRLEYGYHMRQETNGVVLDEWHTPRVFEFDPSERDAVLLMDTWCSAGTVDYAFETDAFPGMRGGEKYGELRVPAGANHCFQLRMAAVPEGLTPCLLGSVDELGGWGWHHAVPLQEVAPNVWRKDLYVPADWEVSYKYGLYDPRLKCVVSLELGENRHLEPRQWGKNVWVQVSDECYRRDSGGLFRGAGVALPVFALRSERGFGVGEFADLVEFGDWAAGTGMKLIQILPINDTTSSHDWTDSYPYSAISVFALHPLYLRIGDLGYPVSAATAEAAEKARKALNGLEHIDHPRVMEWKTRLTREIFRAQGKAIVSGERYLKFLEENRDWVVDYAVFCVLRDEYGTADFAQWGEWAVYDAEKVAAMWMPENEVYEEICRHIWVQAELDHQLSEAVAYLHGKGLALKGDLPIGIDRQSVDAWAAPHLFKMDAQAGAPPDAFAVKGQNWGFPTYDWEVMQADGFAWWRSRFEKLSRYFDAYRIDHILGFFRIWQVPYDQVDGIMGWFDPAVPVHVDEIRGRGIDFDYNRHCRPYIRSHSLGERFGGVAGEVVAEYLHDCGAGYWQLREGVATQRRILDHFETLPQDEHHRWLRERLMDCVSEVLFLEVPGSNGTLFHPRCSMQMTRSYQELPDDMRWRVEQLYIDYFYRRQEEFWQGKGYEKLPAMRRASRMLLCGEDLGMVPACVPGVLKELGILSLEIQRMPKTSDIEFFNPADAPYMSVVSPSTHDMATLRGWWEDDLGATRRFAQGMLGLEDPPPELSGEIASRIIAQHLQSPAMWAIFPLQDLLAMDEELRHPEPDAERINVPAIMPYYWRYRMHLGLDQLAGARRFNAHLRRMLVVAGRSNGS